MAKHMFCCIATMLATSEMDKRSTFRSSASRLICAAKPLSRAATIQTCMQQAAPDGAAMSWLLELQQH